MKTLTQSQSRKVRRALEQHDKHKNAYFWTPSGGASGRRRAEQINNWSVSFRHEGHEYEYKSTVSCSCRNYYYSGEFRLDGALKTRRLFAKLPIAQIKEPIS